jgi:hypothetical protein
VYQWIFASESVQCLLIQHTHASNVVGRLTPASVALFRASGDTPKKTGMLG